MSILSTVTKVAKPLPPRIVMYAQEKFGKSSFASHSWNPIFLMTKGETGLIPLIESGRVPAVAHFPSDFQRWGDLKQAVTELRDDPHDYRTLVLDTGNGAEQLCSGSVCDDSFGGDWSDYGSFGRGDVLASKEWVRFLDLLDAVRIKRRMAVIILHHAKVKTFSDPAGKSWDQWKPEAIEKLWANTHKWADVILFGGFKTTVTKDEKATGESRYLRADSSGAIVAGNRYGLPAEITAPAGALNLWTMFANALTKAKTPKPAEAPKASPEGEHGRPPSANGAASTTTAAPNGVSAGNAASPPTPADAPSTSPGRKRKPSDPPTVDVIVDLISKVARHEDYDEADLIGDVCERFSAADLMELVQSQLIDAETWLAGRLKKAPEPAAV